MNITINTIKNKFDAYYHRDTSKLRITAFRDWAILFVLSGLVLLFALVFAGYVYIHLYAQSELSVPVEVKKTGSSENGFKKEFDQAIAVFEEKKKKHEELLNDGVELFMNKVNNTVKSSDI